jgi:hypothetical protein
MKRNLTVIFSLAVATRLFAIGWPFAPQDSVHPLGNNWGEYQDYGGGPYYHNGIDVFAPFVGAPIRAIAHGWVKGYGTIQADYHYRLAISDSPPGVASRCPGWLYAHIDNTRSHKNVGDEVNIGDTIGYAVPWPVSGFDHTHFARISDTGLTWNRFPNTTWWFTENLLLEITPQVDTVKPVILDAASGQRFALCRNNTNNYLPVNAITGDVDIVVRAYDKTGVTTGDSTWDKLQPYKYVWSVRGSVDSVPPTLGLIFSGLLPVSTDSSLVCVTFKSKSPCQSYGDYDTRDYYNIVTNNADGDSTIDIGDTTGCWHTGLMPDDAYWIKVTVSDVAGNSTTDSMLVHTANGNGIAVVGNQTTWHNLNIPTIVRSGTELAVSFVLPYAQSAKLQLYGPNGRLEYSSLGQEFSAGRHDLRFLASGAGVHLAVLTTGNNRIVSKLTVVQ